MLSAAEEKEVIEREIKTGADALIVQPVPDSGTVDMLKKTEKRIPVILAEHSASKESGGSEFPCVRPDNYAMGKALADELNKDYNGKMDGKTLGIICENKEFGTCADRAAGFRTAMENQDVRILWSVSDPEGKNGGSTGYLEKQKKADFVIALDDYSLIMAGKAAAANDLHGALVYGIGNSTESVYYLDTGFARCMVMPDEFDVGYQSVGEAAESFGYLFRKPQSRTASYTILRKDNLFSIENQEILFTMSQ